MSLIVTLVPDGFVVPKVVEGDVFAMRPLSVKDLEADFSALTENGPHLRSQKIFGPATSWPGGITKDADLADLGWHEVEFRRRSSFAYRVDDATGRYAGCVYIFPSPTRDFDAEIFYWTTRQSEEAGLLDMLGTFLENWVIEEWPFQAPVFPGRSLSWDAYAALPIRDAAAIAPAPIVD